MYMTFPNPKNEKSRALIVFILCVLFLAVAFKVSGQTCIKHKQNSTYFAPCEPILLKFLKDTIKKVAIGIYVENGETILYANYYNNDNASMDDALLIGLTGDKVYSFKPRGVRDNLNYTEFLIPNDYVEKMKLNRFDFFATSSKKQFKQWQSSSYGLTQYFMNFLNNYTKRVDVEILGESYSKY